MKIPEQFVLSRTACIAAVIITLLVGAVVGGNIAQPEKETNPRGLAASPLEQANQAEPIPDYTYSQYTNKPGWSEEDYVNGPIQDPDAWVYPEVYPLSVHLVQMDGGKIHCKPWATSASLSTNGGVTINGQLVEAWEDLDGLRILPGGNGLEYRHVAVIVDGDRDRVAWLPGGTMNTGFTLSGSDWTDDGLFPDKVQLCLARSNG